MNILVAGATGATGRLVVEQLLAKNNRVRAVVRSPESLPETLRDHHNLEITQAAILDLDADQLTELVRDCDAVVSCLGHTLSFKGMFGKPRKLVTDAVEGLCGAIIATRPERPVKFILMNSVGVKNPELPETRKLPERIVLWLLRHFLPPHRDNETAVAHLQQRIGKANSAIEWCAVRPDTLINAPVSPYDIQQSPSTGLFSGTPTSRANVAHFMVALMEKAELWSSWKFRRPVIMNRADATG